MKYKTFIETATGQYLDYQPCQSAVYCTLHSNKPGNIETNYVLSLQGNQNIDRSVRTAASMRKYTVNVAGCLAGESARCCIGTQLKEHIPPHLCSSSRGRRERAFGGDVRVDNTLVAAVTYEALRFAHFPMDIGFAPGRHDEI
jgi:hypothetical protein